MNRFLDVQPKIALSIGISTVVGIGITYGTAKFLKNVYNNRPPKKWRKVGEISNIFCFPIKSCGPIVMDEIECGLLGTHAGHLRDRVFMVTRLSGEFVTARTYPNMLLIKPKIVGDVLSISAPGMDGIQINIASLYSRDAAVKCTIFGDNAECIDCGDEAAQFFSKFILGEDKGFRFVFYPSSQPKPVILDKGYLFEQAPQTDSGALHDETSFMLMNQGSFDELNTRLEQAVTPLQYRPNFVVKGPEPWVEDSWKWVKIGNHTIFKTVQPCLRCILTNINPATGERHPKMEPLKTLKSYRTFNEIATGSPRFGIHLGVRSQGKVKMGDEVFVEDN